MIIIIQNSMGLATPFLPTLINFNSACLPMCTIMFKFYYGYPYRGVVTFMIFTIHCNYTKYTCIHYYVYKTTYKYRIYSMYTRFSLLLVKNNNNNDLPITPQ